MRTLQDILDAASAQMAFTMVLLAIAASVALLLGVIGIYGVMSYIVSQRTARSACVWRSARSRDTWRATIVGQGGLVALAGIVVGLHRRWPAAG